MLRMPVILVITEIRFLIAMSTMVEVLLFDEITIYRSSVNPTGISNARVAFSRFELNCYVLSIFYVHMDRWKGKLN